MLYYALFYATAIPTVVYAQVVGDEDEPATTGDDCTSLDTIMDLSEYVSSSTTSSRSSSRSPSPLTTRPTVSPGSRTRYARKQLPSPPPCESGRVSAPATPTSTSSSASASSPADRSPRLYQQPQFSSNPRLTKRVDDWLGQQPPCSFFE